MRVAFITFVAVCTILAIGGGKKQGLFANAQGIKFEPLGCFRDETTKPRPLPILVKNFRRPPQIDWNNLNKTIEACAIKVKEAGFVYFGLQFYGECWSGPKAHLTYHEDGKSKRCIAGVGMAYANFVYRLVFEECKTKNYKVLDSADRSVHHDYDGSAGCDNNLQPGWYRFQGDAGSTMANECPDERKCGTLVPGWLQGSLPSVKDGKVTRKVCFNRRNNCCRTSVEVEVRNCGGFYVYKLPKAPYCQLRYCGSGKQGE